MRTSAKIYEHQSANESLFFEYRTFLYVLGDSVGSGDFSAGQ